MNPVHGRQQGVEVDVLHPCGCWSIRLTTDVETGAVSLIVVDHAHGGVVLAELLRQPDPDRGPAGGAGRHRGTAP